jgi:DNA-binding NarL/FixJ family response regulator
MNHVLLIEPDDDLCLALRQIVSDVGLRVTITGSLAEADEALAETAGIDRIITDAVLPDCSGVALAQDLLRRGKSVIVLRRRGDRIAVFDREGTVFLGDRVGVGEFIRNSLSRRADEGASAEPGPAAGPQRHGSGKRRA